MKIESSRKKYICVPFQMLAVAVWAWVCAAGVGWASGECVAAAESAVETVEGDAAITLLVPLHNGPKCDQVRLDA